MCGSDTFSVTARGSPSSVRVTGGCLGCRPAGTPSDLPTHAWCDEQLNTQDFPLGVRIGWQPHSSENHQPQPFWVIPFTAPAFSGSQQDVWRRRHGLESQAAPRGVREGGGRGFASLLHCVTSGTSLSLCPHCHSPWCRQPLSPGGQGDQWVTYSRTLHGPGTTVHLIIPNKTICAHLKVSSRKALRENIQQHRVSDTNWFSFRSICFVLLCWITEELHIAQDFIFFPQ